MRTIDRFGDTRRWASILAACLARQFVAFLFVAAAFAQSYSETTTHTFIPAPHGMYPQSSLIQASDGSLYGTTARGGAGDAGTIFRISNPGGMPAESVVYNFTGGADGGLPVSSLTQASDGNLYGTALLGGAGGYGTVFRIENLDSTPTLTVLYTFTGGADGGYPEAGLIQASDGSLYGTTYQGGTAGVGTVFKISNLSDTPTESVIYSFTGGPDGKLPYASLIQASDGNLYGTTSGGGGVFRISDLAGTPTFSVIHTFTGGPDGSESYAALIQASDGNLYGTTLQGGTSYVGTVFTISNLAGTPTESVIYSFTGGADGNGPSAAVIQASDGNLYGTTFSGGANNAGTVFEIANPAGTPTESVIYSFAGGADGAFPESSLIQASDGNLYGTTLNLYNVRTSNLGTVFTIVNLGGTPTESVIYGFALVDGANSDAALIQASDGNLYGTTKTGGTSDAGTVFRIGNLAGASTYSVIYSFTGGADGKNPVAALIQASDGNLYGTTVHGGAGSPGYGAIFKIGNLSSTPTFSLIYTFTGGSDGGNPYASLIEASDGNLYGTTAGGGGVFRISDLAGTPTFSVIHTFTGGAEGCDSYAALIQASDGNLYGTTSYCGGISYSGGTVFKIGNLGGTPTFSVIYTFTGGTDGGNPYASLIQASDGNLYGTTTAGGGSGLGTVFEISNLGGTPSESIIHRFTLADGAIPYAALIQASDGNLYGTTYIGSTGNPGYGEVFEIGNLGGSPTFSVVYIFSGGADGSNPYASLVQASDGNLYGTTEEGGTSGYGYGTVYAMVRPCFDDVPASNPFRSFICTIARDGITAGCGGGNFCPSSSVLRSQMAVFILRGEHGSAYVPPPADCGTYPFSDVPCPETFADYILQSYNEGITSGCGTNPLIYCPSNPVTRSSMAVFLLRAKNGPAYTPPTCAGIFSDVACPSPFADWIEALYNAGITGGCGTNPLQYCPGNSVTRAQMAVFLTTTFGLQ
jgi:uncharacterized repeat protein (TIGR03803 family)